MVGLGFGGPFRQGPLIWGVYAGLKIFSIYEATRVVIVGIAVQAPQPEPSEVVGHLLVWHRVDTLNTELHKQNVVRMTALTFRINLRV